jgi:hypothetical protein
VVVVFEKQESEEGEMKEILPLRYSKPTEGFGYIWKDKTKIADVAFHNGFDVDTQREIARFIVSACNSHYDLLAACESARQIIESRDAMFTDAIRDRAIETLEQLNEVIDRAKGES